jgi:hypothetical protein
VPAVTVTAPVKVFEPDNVSAPAALFMTFPLPDITLLYVALDELLNSMVPVTATLLEDRFLTTSLPPDMVVAPV